MQVHGEGGQGVGIDLVSQGATPSVPSARVGLTTGFEKGPGVPLPLGAPTHMTAGFQQGYAICQVNSCARELQLLRTTRYRVSVSKAARPLVPVG